MEEKKPARLRPWYLYQILLEQTDDLHALTREELSDALAARGILTERKTIYADLTLLREAGVDLIQEKKGHQTYYHIGSRMFELPELKLLVDLVLASRFITKKKSEALIEKLGKLTSVYEAHQLQRQVTVAGRIKAENEQIYYNVDRIHTGINEDRKLHFQYFQWLPDKQKLLRHEGRRYTVSPWALSWDHEKYYLIGYDSDSAMIRHYRVDKILNLEVSEVIGTYVYKRGIQSAQYSFSTVVGLFNNVVNFVILILVNQISKTISDTSLF